LFLFGPLPLGPILPLLFLHLLPLSKAFLVFPQKTFPFSLLLLQSGQFLALLLELHLDLLLLLLLLLPLGLIGMNSGRGAGMGLRLG
jgi:hypothetical protein